MSNSERTTITEGGEEWRRLLQGYFESSPIAAFVIDLDHKLIADFHGELDNTLEMLQNQIGPGIRVLKSYGDIPDVEYWPLEPKFFNRDGR